MATYIKHQPSARPYRLNSFRLEGLENIKAGYRLIQIDNLIETDDYEKKVRQLSNIISGSIKMPTEPVRIKGEQFLAIVGLLEELKRVVIESNYTLTPEVAITTLKSEINELDFLKCRDNKIHSKLVRKALDWAFDKALKPVNLGWWKYGRRFVSRAPDEKLSTGAIQVFEAFYFGFTFGKDGTPELSLDPSICYAEKKNLFEKYGEFIPEGIKGKRFLYRNGLEFYEIDAIAIGKAAKNDLMLDPDTNQPVSIQQHLKNRWKGKNLAAIENLDGEALTIAYKNKSQQPRKAHSQLLYELVGVSGTDEGAEAPHRLSIMKPQIRGGATEELIAELSKNLKLFGIKLNLCNKMRKLDKEIHLFSPPKLRLANDQELTTNLETMRKDRFDALKYIGPAESSDFEDEQMFIYPESLPTQIRLDVKKRFCDMVKELSGKPPNFQNLAVADQNRPVLREQFNEIKRTIGNKRGYGLFLLPKERKRGQTKKLHDTLKRNFWKQVQTQCASVEHIMSFYKISRNNYGEKKWIVNDSKIRQYKSYLQFLALGYLKVNRKWLWKLGEGTLRNEVHVGIDVYQDLSVFTFIYGDADLITFHLSQSKKGERLSASQVKDALYDNLRRDLSDLGLCPSKIVFHRDGKVFDTEIFGIEQTLETLKKDELLDEDYQYGIVEIHKTSSVRPRLYKWQNFNFENPEMGIFAELSSFEGILATTGQPSLHCGTAQPLTIVIRRGNISLINIAHDINALSHLAFDSPGSAMSLPFTISLADGILRESSPGQEFNIWDEEDEEIKNASVSQQPLVNLKTGVAVV